MRCIEDCLLHVQDSVDIPSELVLPVKQLMETIQIHLSYYSTNTNNINNSDTMSNSSHIAYITNNTSDTTQLSHNKSESAPILTFELLFKPLLEASLTITDCTVIPTTDGNVGRSVEKDNENENENNSSSSSRSNGGNSGSGNDDYSSNNDNGDNSGGDDNDTIYPALATLLDISVGILVNPTATANPPIQSSTDSTDSNIDTNVNSNIDSNMDIDSNVDDTKMMNDNNVNSNSSSTSTNNNNNGIVVASPSSALDLLMDVSIAASAATTIAINTAIATAERLLTQSESITTHPSTLFPSVLPSQLLSSLLSSQQSPQQPSTPPSSSSQLQDSSHINTTNVLQGTNNNTTANNTMQINTPPTRTLQKCTLPFLSALDEKLGELMVKVEERILRGTNHSSVWQRPLALAWAQPAKV